MKKKWIIYGGYFEEDEIEQKIDKLEEKVNDEHFWDDKKNSAKVFEELNSLKNKKNKVITIKEKIQNNLEILQILKEHEEEDLKNLIEMDLEEIETLREEVTLELLLSKEYDKEDAIIDIHSGAGGTEACDWVAMLYRMYTRWCEKKKYKIEILDEQKGEEAGYKSVSFIVKGMNSYGYLKCEKGVHRLVRISPFDSNKRRHTSFAAVEVSPVIENASIFEINEKDIRIDVYRSSGCGGQGVNTTDSAVRITHLPTKTVVTCQNERSQIKNKETAMEVLKSKLYALELEKREKELNEIKGEQREINFGSQIRSYVMQPYQMVKDHRTNTEISNVDKVLDGDIDTFISDNLRKGI